MVGNHERGGQGRSGKYIVFMLSHENWKGGTALGKGGARFEENFIMGLPASFGLLLPAFCVAPQASSAALRLGGPGWVAGGLAKTGLAR